MGSLTTSHTSVSQDLYEAQDNEYLIRDRAKAAEYFVNLPDGQWEPALVREYYQNQKPRYTLDRCSGIISDITGEMSAMDFSSRVRPNGGGASKDIALHYDGMLRAIQNSSKANHIYRAAGKDTVTSGIGGWRIITDYPSSLSANQSFIIKPVSGFLDRVWFSPGYEMPDASDADYAFMLTQMPLKKYKEKWPDGSQLSVGSPHTTAMWNYQSHGTVIVSEYFKKVTQKADIVIMSDNSVYLADDKFMKVKDELFAQGIVIKGERTANAVRVIHSLFDGDGWLESNEETVFDLIPLVPALSNFKIIDGSPIFYGVVEKLMDPQRVLNYSESRKVEEGALAPRSKIAASDEQMSGYEEDYETMNTNMSPYLPYNKSEDPNDVPPYRIQGAQINPGLSETSQSMERHIQSISQNLDAARTDRMGMQSGVALERLQDKQNVGNFEYFNTMEIAVAYSCQVIVNAAPRLLDTKQEIRIDNQDGTSKSVTIHDRYFDKDTGTVVELNDISVGDYDVFCNSGPTYQNKQEQTVDGILKIAAVDPTILQTGSDILLSNIASPGMDKLSGRVRMRMVDQGLIPEDELTDEEKERVAALANQPKEVSATEQAMIKAAQAEENKSLAMAEDIRSKTQEREGKFMLQVEQLKIKNKELEIKARQQQQQMVFDMIKSQQDQISTMAKTLVDIKNAMGVDVIVNENTAAAYDNQSKDLNRAIITSE